jgi:HEAT repeat protein
VRLVDEVMVANHLKVGAELKTMLLQAAASDERDSVRLVAELLCAELGFDAPREMIRRVVGRRFSVREPRDEQRAVILAGKLDLKDTAGELTRRAFGRLGFSLDPFRWTALAALCRWGDQRAFDKLRASLRARSPIDRAAAIQSLADSGHPEALALLMALQGDPGNLDHDVLTQALAAWEGESTAGNT